MKVIVKNVRGLSAAEIDVGTGITLIGGDNRAGKTSLIQSLACALSGSVSPIAGVAKKDLMKIVRDGAEEGYVTVQTEGGAVSILWPKGDMATKGKPPRASTYATGLQHIFDLDWKTRASVMTKDYLKNAEPTFEDLVVEVKKTGILMTEDQLKKIWEIVVARGWDAGQEQCKQFGINLKAEWKGVTGEAYGTSKGESWTPPDWTPDMAEMDTDELKAAAETAAKELEATVGTAAVSQAEIRRLEIADGDVKGLIVKASETETDAQMADTLEESAKTALDAVPRPPTDGDGIKCPCCGENVTVTMDRGGVWKLAKASPLTPDQIKAMTTTYRDADTKYTSARLAARGARNKSIEAAAALERAQSASKSLAEARKNATDEVAVEKARAKVAAAEKLYNMGHKYMSAVALHLRVMRTITLVEILGPDGVRHTKLLESIKAFNETLLAPLCGAAGWPLIQLSNELTGIDNARPFELLSASEQWRCRMIIALAMGIVDKSDVICLDDADMLVEAGRNEFFGMLSQVSTPIVVGMAIDKERTIPDLGAAGLGRTITVRDGVAQTTA